MNAPIQTFRPVAPTVDDDVKRGKALASVCFTLAGCVVFFAAFATMLFGEVGLFYIGLAVGCLILFAGAGVVVWALVAPVSANLREIERDAQHRREINLLQERAAARSQLEHARRTRLLAETQHQAILASASRPIVSNVRVEADASAARSIVPVADPGIVALPETTYVAGVGDVNLRLLFAAADAWPTSRKSLRAGGVEFRDEEYTAICDLLRPCADRAQAERVALSVARGVYLHIPSPG